MFTIYKYIFPDSMNIENTYGIFEIETIKGFVPKFFGIQSGNRCVWGEVAVDYNMKEKTRFQLIGTGKELKYTNEDEPEVWQYIGSAIQGMFVWHLYWANTSFTRIPGGK